MHTRQIFSGEATLHIGISAHAHEYGVVFGEQLRKRYIFADIGIQPKLDAHAFHDRAAATHHVFFQFEFGDTESEQAADLIVAVIHHRLHPVAHQYICAAESGGPRADHGDFFPGRRDLAHVGTPTLLKSFVRNIFLD